MGRTLNPPTSAVREISTVVPVNKGGTGADNVVDAALNIGAIPKAYIGRAGGVGTLNNFGRIPASQLPASIVPEVTLSGSRSLYLSQVATFVISNYDANTTYTLSASSGTISRAGANITYTAPGVAGDYTITVNGRTVTVNVSAVRPTRPVLTSSTSGESVSTAAAYITGSAFAMQSGTGTHLSTDWEIYTDMALTALLSQSLNDTVNKTSWQVTNLSANTTYYARARYRQSTGALSDWSTTLVIQTRDTYSIQLEEAKLTAPVTDTTGNVQENTFYYAVSMDETGTRVAVGNWSGYPTSGGVTGQGRVYIFRREGTTWTLEQAFSASDRAQSDYFGIQVAMDATGTRVLVGAYNKTITFTAQGAAYVFVRNTTTNVWTQEARIDNVNPNDNNEFFGWGIAISGDGARAAISAEGRSSSTGIVFIFTRSGSTWSLEATINHPSPQTSAYFGNALALTSDGSRLVVTAFFQQQNGSINQAGAAWVFRRNGTSWVNEGEIKVDTPTTGAYFGGHASISSDGTRCVVSAKRAVAGGLNNAGAVYVFVRNTSNNTWSREQVLTASDRAADSNFGSSVAMSASGNTIIVGSNYADPSGRTNAGSTYVFTRNGSVWTEVRILSNSDSAANQGLGTSVAISSDGTRAATVAANRATGTYGFLAAYIYRAA